MPASDRIPVLARPYVSERAAITLDLVEQFVENECIPADEIYEKQVGTSYQARFASHPSVLEDLKARAKSLGLWNMFLPKNHFKEGAGFTNLEYGLMAEYLGKSFIGSEACNCSAPDTGNMELLAKYGTEAQKSQWLAPLLEGRIRSAFLMTEPQVASSDATNIELKIIREGDELVLNGQKWWASGVGSPACKVYIVMGKSDPSNPSTHKQQSVVLIPVDTPGITIKRMLSVIGFDDAPHGHGYVTFENVRVPVANMVLGEGRGFEIVQGRLGPGRIHHAMRSIGSAEKALDWFVARLKDPRKQPFGKLLGEQGMMLERVARSRIEIDAARLAVLNAAMKIDMGDAKSALKEIAEVKVQVPAMLLNVLDRAMQAHGAGGLSQDTPLPKMWAGGRTMRVVDGPDEVHMLQLAKNEIKRGSNLLHHFKEQAEARSKLCERYGVSSGDVLELNRISGKANL